MKKSRYSNAMNDPSTIVNRLYAWLALAVVCLMTLLGCGVISPYVPPIQQGNAHLSWLQPKLHLGMSEAAVLQLLGRPVLTQTKQQDHQLIYIEQQSTDRSTQVKQLTLYFQKGRLHRIVPSTHHDNRHLLHEAEAHD